MLYRAQQNSDHSRAGFPPCLVLLMRYRIFDGEIAQW